MDATVSAHRRSLADSRWASCPSADHYLFEAVAAPVRYLEFKGRVESSIKYIRHSFFYGRLFASLDDLRDHAAPCATRSPINASTPPPMMRERLRVQSERRAHMALKRSAILPLVTMDSYDFDYPILIDRDVVHRASRFPCNVSTACRATGLTQQGSPHARVPGP